MSHPVTIVQAKLPLKGCKILQKGPYCKISPISFNTTASTAPRNYKARGGGARQGLTVHPRNLLNEPIQPTLFPHGYYRARQCSQRVAARTRSQTATEFSGRDLRSTSGLGLERRRYRNAGLGRRETGCEATELSPKYQSWGEPEFWLNLKLLKEMRVFPWISLSFET